MTDMLSRPLGTAADGPTPPQALDAERSVLAAMLLDQEAVGRAIEMTEASDFYRVAHQKIFDGILALYSRNEQADLITLSEEMRKRGELEAVGGIAALSQILEYATTSANLEQHVKIIRSKSVLRLLIRASSEIQQECFAGGDETGSILDRAEQRIFEITDARVRQGFVALRDLLKPAFEHIQQLYERKVHVTGVPSGYDDLDKLTSGFQPSDLVVIAGRPSMGKTSLALNVAENAAIRHKVPVALFSLEMSKEQLVLRMLCSQSEVALHKVRNGFLGHEDWPRLTTGAGLLTQAPIMIDDSAALTVLEIRAKCRRLKAEGKLGLVVIDYLQLVRTAGQVENRVQEISQITRALKALAKELSVPVIALSQLSRAVETRGGGGRPQLSDLRESGCLTADTRILRADTGAEVSMGELLLKGERNIPVWTLDEDLGVVRGTMTHVFASGVKPVFEMRLASGRHIKASANHPFRTLDGWKPLESLIVGDRLAVPRRIPEPERSEAWPEPEIVMLAHMLGDGCFASRQPVHYTSADPANIEVVERAAAHFGITPRRLRQGNWWHVYLPAPFRLTHGRRNPVQEWLSRFGLAGLRSYEKFIPREIQGLPLDQAALFLRHLWATDGCVHLGTGRLPRIYYASTSERLIRDLQTLLSRFGLLARIKQSVKGEYRTLYHLHLSGVENQMEFLKRIGVHGARGRQAQAVAEFLRGVAANTNVDTIPREVWGEVRATMKVRGMTTREFASAIGSAYCGSTLYRDAPSRPRLSSVAAVLDSPRLSKLAASDVFWDSITAIEPRGEEPVFDATVPGTNNFIADGIVAHNSIEQDADVVMFVWREEKYKPDDPTLKGKADILIAKQRNGPTGDVTMTFLQEYTKFVPYSPMMPGETESGF
ncbi:MAG: replicative DNA helicase [Candidatus Eisenbacteria bacterium]|nr:replicative DNA helicase [Candidatus Eisenbacteria bacterium]